MPEVESQPTATERVRRALLRPSPRQLVAGLLLAALGFAAVTQVRITDTDDSYSGLREQELIDVLNALSGTRQRTQSEIDRLEGVAGDLRDDTTKRETALEQAQDEVDALGILAGLEPVTGPGVRITIKEEDGRVRLSSMLDVIVELRTVEAEAIAINGEVRVVAQTSFTEADGGFLVDGKLVSPPYVIDAIGDPASLSGAMDFGLGPKQEIVEDGATLATQELQTLDIEAVVDRSQPRYAVPDPGQ